MPAVVDTCISCLKLIPPGSNAVFRDRISGSAGPLEFRDRTSTHVQCYLGSGGDHGEVRGRQALAGIHVLVVEHHPDTLDVMRTMLENFGAVVTGAGTARQGHDALRQVRPDVLVSDISMPHDGFELIRELIAFAAETGVTVPAVAITSNGTARDLIRRAGFAAVVSKPFDPLALAALIGRLASPASPVNP